MRCMEHTYNFRDLPQGSRLTAFELVYENIPATLVVDSAAAALMNGGGVNAVIVGADRVAANGTYHGCFHLIIFKKL